MVINSTNVTYVNYNSLFVLPLQSSDITQWQSVYVPPDLNLAPVLKVITNERDNLTLRVEPGADNQKCKAEEYKVS